MDKALIDMDKGELIRLVLVLEKELKKQTKLHEISVDSEIKLSDDNRRLKETFGKMWEAWGA